MYRNSLARPGLWLLVLAAGCGSGDAPDFRPPDLGPPRSGGSDWVGDGKPEGRFPQAGQGAAGGQAAEPNADGAGKAQRKVKYTAEIHLITDDFTKVEEGLLQAIDVHKGFVAHADVESTPGQPRRGLWKARVPVQQFESFRRAVAKLAEVHRSGVQTQDVTAEFYDLEQHVKNRKAHEEALRELLRKTTDKMENLLAVRRELASVRDEIERAEGRLRLLTDLTELTTVTIHLQERAKFDPAPATPLAERPTFGARAGKAFEDSRQTLLNFLQAVAVALVASVPWLVALLPGAALLLWAVRRRRPSGPPPLPPTPGV